ncbi:hypothetical protein G4G28_19365 [Massilia sp. Dwa41.01b]|uniref:hypothetical protein n=1 Tax=Massilia sp. Dwa41.01b TaxID=2709302 RepID=UPI0016012ECC|nr:hypothetical protein [Massilia sp. Dwa41.01b]QNA90118.1 hypothetical protein G4G28_19365 [Massilia sp. Dwa41.01b]
MQPVKLMPHDVATLPPAAASVRAARLSLARSHTAIFPTNLALARWTAGCCLPHLAGSARPTAARGLVCPRPARIPAWLESGGFVQHDEPASSDDAVTLCDAAPDGTAS